MLADVTLRRWRDTCRAGRGRRRVPLRMGGAGWRRQLRVPLGGVPVPQMLCAWLRMRAPRKDGAGGWGRSGARYNKPRPPGCDFVIVTPRRPPRLGYRKCPLDWLAPGRECGAQPQRGKRIPGNAGVPGAPRRGREGRAQWVWPLVEAKGGVYAEVSVSVEQMAGGVTPWRLQPSSSTITGGRASVNVWGTWAWPSPGSRRARMRSPAVGPVPGHRTHW